MIAGFAKDGKSVTWKLKKNVTWHDGKPFTADDLVFNWEYASDPATSCVTIGSYKDCRAEKVDSHTVRVTFQKPTPFPGMSIRDNVAAGLKVGPKVTRAERDSIVETALKHAALWDEVKDRLDSLGTKLSGGQQQRLTIARALSHQPEILCLDEFSIAIDPVTTMRIEDVLKELRKEMTIILVTNLVQQARRLAARTMFLWNGEIIELDTNEVMFSDQAKDKRTRDYVNGIFG